MWNNLRKKYASILKSEEAGLNFDSEWMEFKEIALSIEKNPPPAVSSIQNSLNQIEKYKDRKNIKIFDHGCGAGLKIIYLATIGYTSVYGVNVNFDVNFINKILKKKFNIKENHFFITKGKTVPFKNKFFDFIISSQVVEHLTEDEIIIYYSEEGRVLKKNGYAYHEVPHKFMPYESHSRIWFVHLFPYIFKPFLYGLFISLQQKKNLFYKGRYFAEYYSKSFLILRSPYFHKKMILKYIGNFQDLTLNRLKTNNDFSSYDKDSPLLLRKFIQNIFLLPILGGIFVFIFKYFFILQTLSKKR